jgi:hypothetical protein
VTVSADVPHIAHVSAARFTVCPSASGAVCAVGDLPTGQSDELLASVSVARAVSAGTKITLTATASGTGAGSFHSAATMLVTSAPKSPSSPSPTQPVTTQPVPPLPALPGSVTTLPGVGTSLAGVGTSAQNPGSLFPTVSPGASTSPNSSAAGGQGTGHPHRVNAANASATLPLDPRLIGGQLAGLAVLAGAIAIAVARLSLRSPRPQSGKSANK